ncbi:hypothetical protein CPG37_07195 [Malaciobacter canalis]|uniref:Membrane transporter protein n=1 Tax=Malaciobacter canalis TaxID=1912871 RepID=A0ABX4LPF4_9BACT|nr:hypothetical protein [Malaciobacter canalis]PHO09795.1 hypothetical protein CPG37_07195 [Malaciobacter canalis]
MDLDFFIVASIVLIIAAFVHGSIGFGFALIPTPIIAIFTDIQTAILLTLIPTLVVNLVSFLSEGNILDGLKKHMPLAVKRLMKCELFAHEMCVYVNKLEFNPLVNLLSI